MRAQTTGDATGRQTAAVSTGRRATDGARREAREPAPTSAKQVRQDAGEEPRAPLVGATARSQSDKTTRVPEIGSASRRNTAETAPPGIAALATNDAGGARTSMTAQPKLAVRNRGRKRKAEADADARATEDGRQRRRRDADAREARAARRQAARHEPEAS
ncbi:hypothetical protein PF004_g31008 [Phytophthora fragariae]|uniref:Uncharacterized protein n=1 Tax=Phytophthora fragariae TaxID=53985 RepID=A0A6G0MAA6_9STRA|nr:hypothetical protein PF004_g31008 [Phytophthora fragariae]